MSYENNQTSAEAFIINDEFKSHVLPVSAIFGVFACTGILGNLFVCYVHIFKYKNCNFRFFVLGLCAVDLLSSVTILPLEIYTQLNWYVFPSQWLCKLKAFMNAFTSVASVYVLLLIAVDRHRKICAPYSWQLTNQSVLIGYGIFFVLACCQCWPVLIVWGLQSGPKHYHGMEVILTVCSRDPAVKDTQWPNVFIIMMCPHFLAMLIMLILYILVGKQIFGVVLTMRRQASLKCNSQKSAMKKRNTSIPCEESGGSLEASVGGISSAHNTLSSDNGHAVDTYEKSSSSDRDIDQQEYTRNCEMPSNVISVDEYNSTLDRHHRQRCADKRPSANRKTRNVSVESGESTDMELVIYEIQDHGISIKTSKITKSSKKKKRRSSKGRDSKNEKQNSTDTLKRRVRFSMSARYKLRRRTLITFVFTAIFIGTTIMYIIFSLRVAHENTTQSLSFSQLTAFLFFYRLYFINSVIHPVLYGFLDPRFRKTMKSASQMVVNSVLRSIHEPEHREDRG